MAATVTTSLWKGDNFFVADGNAAQHFGLAKKSLDGTADLPLRRDWSSIAMNGAQDASALSIILQVLIRVLGENYAVISDELLQNWNKFMVIAFVVMPIVLQ